MKKLFLSNVMVLAGIFLFVDGFCQNPVPSAPPDQPAQINVSGKRIEITYNNHTLFSGTMNLDNREVNIRQVNHKTDNAVSQVIKFTSLSKKHLTITG